MKESPILSGIDRTPKATVPEGYFNGFPARMMARIREEEQQAPVRRLYPSLSVLYPYVAAAIVVIAFAFIVVLYTGRTGKTPAEPLLADIHIDDLNLQDFDEDLLVDFAATHAVAMHSHDADALGNYILNNVDEDLLIENL